MSPQPIIQPLSTTQRSFFFRFLIVVFVISVPVLFLYSTGYRLSNFTQLVKTGGMYVGAERSGAEIYINGELVRETGTFRRAFFVQDLDPATYTIEVTKDGYYPWGKTLPVYAHIVTEAQAFNIPKEPLFTLIPATLTPIQQGPVTAADVLKNPVYEEIHAVFATTTPVSAPALTGASSTSALAQLEDEVATSTKELRGMKLIDVGTQVVAEWTRSRASIPFYFCTQERGCVDEIVLNTKDDKASHFDFFPGSSDLVIVTLSDGVYVTEIDNRSGQNIQPLYEEKGADFRVIDGSIYIETNVGALYEVEV